MLYIRKAFFIRKFENSVILFKQKKEKKMLLAYWCLTTMELDNFIGIFCRFILVWFQEVHIFKFSTKDMTYSQSINK
jgi:hypothetical protein